MAIVFGLNGVAVVEHQYGGRGQATKEGAEEATREARQIRQVLRGQHLAGHAEAGVLARETEDVGRVLKDDAQLVIAFAHLVHFQPSVLALASNRSLVSLGSGDMGVLPSGSHNDGVEYRQSRAPLWRPWGG